ncbi:MAG TPA: class II aldolase/adducin family protein [Armatimonadetes bacterium]|jgi:L-fuculose-phosphate aldolase|nr:class II aldolase/adducin family protein [Armatimonadota bacterium]HHX42315.1 class II aldolase/adducin family protein [Armatimonadota bacterium]HOJ20275.1 class II aldolase/adducin family protein [Armatimonadota bacterium]HOM80147.1 class II aldolase/adducin family protein [Armatimonadota bacterium]HOQ27552.1 class II aldolase/adducin family protein [Armatimonadota bacterium]
MKEEFHEERRAVARCMRRVYRLRLTSATGGNISCRAGADRFAITPSGIDKARIRAREVGLIDLEGRNLTPELKPSCEWLMHLRIYQRYPSVGAIVHAHPVTLSAFSCAETPIDIGLLSETYALLDPPVVAPYALMGTEELAEIVAECAGRSSAILLRNHAVVTTGANLMQAFSRLEVLEEAARVTLITRQLEGVRGLSPEQRAELDRFMGRDVRPAKTDELP